MIQDVYQIFSNLQTKYPIIQTNLEKCFKEIQAKFVGEQVSSKEDKKGKVKKLLKSFMDMKHLEMSYQGLIDETANNENEFIQLLKKLSEASLSCKTKTTMFASRQGRLLRDAKTFLLKPMLKHVRDMCAFTTRYVNFFISFYQLLEEFPRLCYCAVPIRTFMLNMKKLSGKSVKKRLYFGRTYLRTILYAVILLNDVTQCRHIIYGQQRFPLFDMTPSISYQDN